MDKSRLPTDEPRTVKIGFPVTCHYRGGHTSLGRHGTHLWISKDKIGYGELKLTHGLPLTDVTSVDVKEREFGGSDAQAFLAAGTGSARVGPRRSSGVATEGDDRHQRADQGRTGSTLGRRGTEGRLDPGRG